MSASDFIRDLRSGQNERHRLLRQIAPMLIRAGGSTPERRSVNQTRTLRRRELRLRLKQVEQQIFITMDKYLGEPNE